MAAKHPLARLLIAQGVLAEEQLAKAMALREREPLSMLECLVKVGALSEEALAKALAKALNLPYASRENKLLRPEAGAGLERVVSEKFAREQELVPLLVDGGAVVVAMADPTNLLAVDDLRMRTGLEVRMFVAPRGEVLAAIDDLYRAGAANMAAVVAEEPEDGLGLRDNLRSGGGGDITAAGASAAAVPSSAAASLPLGAGGRWGEEEERPGFFARVFGRGAAKKESPASDAVDCSVYAMQEARPGDKVLVQVFAHMPEQADEARAAAVEADADATRRGVSVLGTRIARGSRLILELVIPGAEVDEPVQALVWRGRTDSVQFTAAVPAFALAGNLIGKLLVSQDGVPIGEVRFKLKVTAAVTSAGTLPAPAGEARRYSMAFVSYASKDRAEVLRRVQMLPAAGIKFFQDVVDLEPGENWNDMLYKRIDEADVMFLFWSGAAKDSHWVQKEWSYGLEKKGPDFIRPILLEGPPVPAPPTELSHLHFNDKLLYFMKVQAGGGPASS